MVAKLFAGRLNEMQYTTTFRGSGLVEELRVRDQMTDDEARSWIEERTGRKFHPDAMYKLLWPQHVESSVWSRTEGLRIHIMADHELATMEREVRKYNKMGKRNPGDPPMFDYSMGRAPGEPLGD